MDYQNAIEWLYSTQLFGIKLGTENVTRLLGDLGVLRDMEATRVVHVAGTNGKGSVCAFTERILRDGELKTGLFTSPHLVSYRERIQVSGEVISEVAVADLLSDIRKRVKSWDQHPTFFEISLVIALRHFCDQRCEVVILETGMGGRLDATNAVQADVSVITSIALDHQEWLGDTIREIAAEKAGIIKRDVPVIVADLDPEARDVVGRRALTLGVPCIEVHPLPLDWEIGLKGSHQRDNAALAVEAACRVEGERLSQDGIRQSLKDTRWPGRFEIVEEKIILDGAHNSAAALALQETWVSVFRDEKAHLVFGAAELKDIEGVLVALLPIVQSISLVPIQSERRLTKEQMREALDRVGSEVPVTEVETLDEALSDARSRDGLSLVAGSLFLVGEARGILLGDEFEVSLQ